jgi:hypothetical protein
VVLPDPPFWEEKTIVRIGGADAKDAGDFGWSVLMIKDSIGDVADDIIVYLLFGSPAA